MKHPFKPKQYSTKSKLRTAELAEIFAISIGFGTLLSAICILFSK